MTVNESPRSELTCAEVDALRARIAELESRALIEELVAALGSARPIVQRCVDAGIGGMDAALALDAINLALGAFPAKATSDK